MQTGNTLLEGININILLICKVFLVLGFKFSLPSTARVTNVITNFLVTSNIVKYNHPLTKLKKRQIRNFLNKNKYLLTLQSDKGDVTAAIEREVYLHHCATVLSDEKYYKVIAKDRVPLIQSQSNKIVTNLKDKVYITTLSKSLVT